MFKFLRKTALWILILPSAISFIGAACNQAVLVANNDTFPVRINEIQARHMIDRSIANGVLLADDVLLPDGTIMLDKVHCYMTPKTHLNWLADNFDLQSAIYSVGDGLLELGDYIQPSAWLVWMVVIIGKLNTRENVKSRIESQIPVQS